MKEVKHILGKRRFALLLTVAVVLTMAAPAWSLGSFYTGRDLAVWCVNYKVYMERHGAQDVKFENLARDINTNISTFLGVIDGVVAMKSGENIPADQRLVVPDGLRIVHLAADVVHYVDQRPQELSKSAARLIYDALLLKYYVKP